MNKNEFLKKLKIALSNDVSQSVIDSQIKYYDDYISNEIKSGRKEQNVLDELGDPNLIAKTIKQVSPEENTDSYNNINNEFGDDPNSNNTNYKNIFGNGSYRQFSGGSVSCLIIGIVMFLILYSVLQLIGSLIYGGLYLIAYYPLFILVIGLIIFLVYFKGRGR